MSLLGVEPSPRFTERLRLEPIARKHADDYHLVFQDDAIAEWYAGKPTREEAEREVGLLEAAWRRIGVHKWLAYDCESNEVVGRGGLSAMPVGPSGDLRSFMPREPWADESFGDDESGLLARRWAEIGWALRGKFWGRGLAAEIGRAGLRFAFDELGMFAVVSFTERHNTRSRAVMERIGMSSAGEFLGRGLIEGRDGVHDGAPFSVCVAHRDTWQRDG
jgi:RimJ/RimL family protein N-acetyltransferase